MGCAASSPADAEATKPEDVKITAGSRPGTPSVKQVQSTEATVAVDARETEGSAESVHSEELSRRFRRTGALPLATAEPTAGAAPAATELATIATPAVAAEAAAKEPEAPKEVEATGAMPEAEVPLAETSPTSVAPEPKAEEHAEEAKKKEEDQSVLLRFLAAARSPARVSTDHADGCRDCRVYQLCYYLR